MKAALRVAPSENQTGLTALEPTHPGRMGRPRRVLATLGARVRKDLVEWGRISRTARLLLRNGPGARRCRRSCAWSWKSSTSGSGGSNARWTC